MWLQRCEPGAAARRAEDSRPIVDGALYTKRQLAMAMGQSVKWIERNLMYPEHGTTKKPLCRCGSCDAEFSFPNPPKCPRCGSTDVELVPGVPFCKAGGTFVFSGRQLRLWAEDRARSCVREAWKRYATRLESAKHVE